MFYLAADGRGRSSRIKPIVFKGKIWCVFGRYLHGLHDVHRRVTYSEHEFKHQSGYWVSAMVLDLRGSARQCSRSCETHAQASFLSDRSALQIDTHLIGRSGHDDDHVTFLCICCGEEVSHPTAPPEHALGCIDIGRDRVRAAPINGKLPIGSLRPVAASNRIAGKCGEELCEIEMVVS